MHANNTNASHQSATTHHNSIWNNSTWSSYQEPRMFESSNFPADEQTQQSPSSSGTADSLQSRRHSGNMDDRLELNFRSTPLSSPVESHLQTLSSARELHGGWSAAAHHQNLLPGTSQQQHSVARSVATDTLAGQLGADSRGGSDGLVMDLADEQFRLLQSGNLAAVTAAESVLLAGLGNNNNDVYQSLLQSQKHADLTGFGDVGSSKLPPPGLTPIPVTTSNALLSAHSALQQQQSALYSADIMAALHALKLNDGRSTAVRGGVQQQPQQQQLPSPTSPPAVGNHVFVPPLSAATVSNLTKLEQFGVLDDVLQRGLQQLQYEELQRQAQIEFLRMQQQQQQQLQQLQNLSGGAGMFSPFGAAAVGQLPPTTPRSAGVSNTTMANSNIFNFSQRNMFGRSDFEASVHRSDAFLGGANNYSNTKWWDENTYGPLPASSHPYPMQTTYSSKIFLGGIPWDLTNSELQNTFMHHGLVSIEHPKGNKNQIVRPHRSSTKAKDGYVYLLLENDKCVARLLMNVCQRREDGKFYMQLSSEKMQNKDSEVIPWVISDSTYMARGYPLGIPVDTSKTVFVGALHGELTAERLAKVMSDLFGMVIYCGIDTDKHKYPIGSGRVTFKDRQSYIFAVHACHVEVKTSKFSKRLQIDPYLEDSHPCQSCRVRTGPLFCRDVHCLQYFCSTCWEAAHGPFSAHEPEKRNQKKQQRR